MIQLGFRAGVGVIDSTDLNLLGCVGSRAVTNYVPQAEAIRVNALSTTTKRWRCYVDVCVGGVSVWVGVVAGVDCAYTGKKHSELVSS